MRLPLQPLDRRLSLHLLPGVSIWIDGEAQPVTSKWSQKEVRCAGTGHTLYVSRVVLETQRLKVSVDTL